MESVEATFFTDPWLMLLAGSIFAVAAGANGQPLLTRASFWYGLIVAMVVTVAAIVFYVIRPEWMMLYIIRWDQVPKWLGWSLFLLYPIPYTASYALGIEFKKLFNNGDRLWFVVTAVCAVIIHALIYSYWTTWTTTVEYQAGFRGNFFSSPLWIYLGIATVISVLSTVVLFWIAYRSENKPEGA